MSLISRGPIRIGRAQREYRDDRVFIVATEDTYAPKQYFEGLHLRRAKVIVFETEAGSGLSSPGHVVRRLVNAFMEEKRADRVQNEDEFWVMLDTDHHIKESHKGSLIEALKEAKDKKFKIAMSNPCFELWLLLHHKEVARSTPFPDSSSVGQELKKILGTYNKCAIDLDCFPPSRVSDAIQRARRLEEDPDDPKGHWPENPGTRVYQLMETILGRR